MNFKVLGEIDKAIDEHSHHSAEFFCEVKNILFRSLLSVDEMNDKSQQVDQSVIDQLFPLIEVSKLRTDAVESGWRLALDIAMYVNPQMAEEFERHAKLKKLIA